MRKVYLSSDSHYRFQKGAHGVVLVEFTSNDETLCPKMDSRASFIPEEGKIIHHFNLGEKVEFIYRSYPVEIGVSLVGSKIECGDDLAHLLRNSPISDPSH